jgi:DNA repair protein RecN (Recombination protein N)
VLRRLRVENLVLIREAELELGGGLNAITGETGAGKTILANAIGLLLGGRGEAAMIGAAAAEAYVEAEFELPALEALGELAGLRPDGETTLVLARRIFADGRTRAYAWGRSAAREDVAAAVEALVAMSGQFEQRRLARPSYQLAVLDSFAGTGELLLAARQAWRELGAARREHERLSAEGAAGEARVAELRVLAADGEGLEAGRDEELAAERTRLRSVSELAAGVEAALAAVAPEEGEGAADLAAAAQRALAPLAGLAPELAHPAEALGSAELAVREVASELRGFLASLEADPARLEQVEGELERIADLRRRHRAASYEELRARAAAARAELEAIDEGGDPAAAAALALAEAASVLEGLHERLGEARARAAPRLEEAVAVELAAVGLREGAFRVELGAGDPGPSGRDEVVFAVRANAGLPFRPLSESASGGELSRIALAIAAVAGGETMIFDEIDAGIGGTTAHAVGQTLRRLSDRAQVITITHLPQIASLADRHFRVLKVPGDPTHTTIEPLGPDERHEELERMLGGAEFLARLSSGGDG